jgi:hypothetical protein
MWRSATYKTTETLKPTDTIYTFKKEAGSWYIDLPEYLETGGRKTDLEMVDGADELLDLLARREKKVSLEMDVQPFENADVLELVHLCEAPKGGGYYKLDSYRSRPLNKEIWLCDVALFVFGDLPEKIYIKARNS